MAKKSKTGRKKKDESYGESSQVDVLSEDHTIADSFTDAAFDMDDDNNNNNNVDDLLSTGSLGSVANAAAAASNRHGLLMDALSSAHDICTESRSAKREAALRTLFHALTHYGTSSTTDSVVVVAAVRHSIRVGEPAEQYAACRVAEALGIVLGNCYNALEDLRLLLTTLVTSSRSTMVRIAALRALAALHFMCGTDDVEQLLDMCEQVATPPMWRNHVVPMGLKAAALECWALLATTMAETLSTDDDGDDDYNNSGGGGGGRGILVLPLLQLCLAESTSMELQSAAGLCLSLIHESRWNVGHDKFTQGSWEGSPHEGIIAELQQRISELSTESANHLAKKLKKEQRSTFRDYRATIVDDDAPEEIISFRGGSITLTTWRELIPLNFVKNCLQGGFQIQLLTNPFLQAMFGADANVLNGMISMSNLEKRLLLSKTSEVYKNADQKLTKDRNKRNNIKNHFLTADAESLYE